MDSAGDNEDYWNTSANKAFSFDEQDEETTTASETFGRYRLIADDNISEVSFELPSNEIPIQLLISENDLKMVLNEQSLDESPFRKGMSVDEELRLLRRKVQDMNHPPPAEITTNKMLLGKKCSLEPYKSLSDKIQLLDEVIHTGNGDAILGIVLFLAKTLNKKQLNRILMTRNEACNQYLNYLIIRMKISEATDILTMLGRNQEAAILEYRMAVTMHSDPQIKKQRLKKVFNDHFSQTGALPLYTQLIASAINLLEWQMLEQSTGETTDLVGSSPVETLFYACSKHKWKDSHPNDPRSPHKLAADHQISSAHFEWVALNERAKSQAYLDLDGLFEKSKWNPLKQKQFHMNIPIDVTILRLYALGAPAPVLNSFLSKVPDHNKKLVLAKEVKATRSVIDALVGLKDKQELEKYRDSLIEGTEERFYAENSLKNLNRKWSTDGIKLMKNSNNN